MLVMWFTTQLDLPTFFQKVYFFTVAAFELLHMIPLYNLDYVNVAGNIFMAKTSIKF